MKVYLDIDEYYPWISISTDKGHFDTEVEMPEEEYTAFAKDLSIAYDVQRRLKKIHPDWKNED